MTSPDLTIVEAHYRAGQISHREIGRQHGRSESWVRKLAKRNGWTRDLAGAVRNRVRESLVREGSRQSELMGVKPSDAAIIDEAAAIGVAVVRSHRHDINALRVAAVELLAQVQWEIGNPQAVPLKITDRSRVIADLSAVMARLVPLERQAFGLDEDRPQGSQPMTVVWEGMPQPAYD
jgi:hypothetical protein